MFYSIKYKITKFFNLERMEKMKECRISEEEKRNRANDGEEEDSLKKKKKKGYEEKDKGKEKDRNFFKSYLFLL